MSLQPKRSPAPVIPAPRRPVAVVPAPHGPRHRRDTPAWAAVLDVVGCVGSAVSLAALLVVATAVGGATDGQHPTDTTLTISSDGAE